MRELYFTKREALQDIKQALQDGYDGYLSEMHNEVFNMKYYIIGTYEAKKALSQYGVFEAIEKIQEYENGHFGEIYTDFSNPEKVANILYYIIGEEALNEILQQNNLYDYWNEEVTEEISQKIIKKIDEELEEL